MSISKQNIFLVVGFNFIIALFFFIEAKNSPITSISSDLANIIPICKKIDNPNLFKNDLFLNDINNIKYYTPFYVETLRFLSKISNNNYIYALAILSFITHFLYGIIWFFAFYFIKKDFWISFLFSVLVRGIIWPPGMEILGISDLWTIMPRTIFMALIPLPFIFYKISNGKYIFASILLGLISNFHPISGIGAIVGYLSLYIFTIYFNKNKSPLQLLKALCVQILFIFIGLFPFIKTYFLNVKSKVYIDNALLNKAIHVRIPNYFFDSFLFIQRWNIPITYVLFGILFFYYFVDTSKYKQNFKLIFITILILFISSNSSIFIEKQFNSLFNLNLRFSFQLVRYQKFILMFLLISFFMLCVEIAKKFNLSNKAKSIFFLTYLLLLSFSNMSFIKSIPFFSDDISRYILPNHLMIKERIVNTHNDYENALNYIISNTSPDALFYSNNIYLRAATSRSEILDKHAAGMLIEGNTAQYLKWYEEYINFKKMNQEEKLIFLKSKNVNYIYSTTKWDNLLLVFNKNNQYIYKI